MNFPLTYASPSEHLFEDDGSIPNNPKLPLLLYIADDPRLEEDLAATFEQRFGSNSWEDCWRNGIYDYHHYHSLTHEVLGVYAGRAQVAFGGEAGIRVELNRGDFVVIPAGVGHKKLDSTADFGVVGAYPAPHRFDLLRGDPSDRPEALENIRQVPPPKADPIFGETGPLRQIWSRATAAR